MTWITGAIAFTASIGTAFTGYLVQQNFDSQWIATQAKDGLNSSARRTMNAAKTTRPRSRPTPPDRSSPC